MDLVTFFVVTVVLSAVVARHQEETGEAGLWERVWVPAGRRLRAAVAVRRRG